MKGPAHALDASIVTGLFRRQATKVRKYLSYRLRSDDDGQDAMQDTFLRLLRREREGALRDESNSYLFSAAFTVAIDIEREKAHAAKNVVVDADADTMASGASNPEDQVHWRRAMSHFIASIRKLDEGPRKVVVMRYIKGMTHPQIAAQLGLTLRTTERHHARALAQLREQMKDYL